MTNIKNELEVHLKRMKNVQFLSGIPDSITRKIRLKKLLLFWLIIKMIFLMQLIRTFHGRHPSFYPISRYSSKYFSL